MMFDPSSVLIVGVEDDPSGMLRVYIGGQYPRRYILIEHEDDKERARAEWARSGAWHLFMKRPPADAIFEETS